MTNVLFAIHPDYVEKILSGEKFFELRTVRCQRPIARIVIYATVPVCRIVGETAIGQVFQSPPSMLWPEIQHGAGVSKDVFDAYFQGRPVAVAYQLEQPVQYQWPVRLEVLGIKRPPQSFCYLLDEQYRYLSAVVHDVDRSSF